MPLLLSEVLKERTGGHVKLGVNDLVLHSARPWRLSRPESVHFLLQRGGIVPVCLYEKEDELAITHLRKGPVVQQTTQRDQWRALRAIVVAASPGEAIKEEHPAVPASEDGEPSVQIAAEQF